MSFLNTLKTVIESLSHSKLRSLLTILGIIIGVAAVILVLALGTGATQSVLERFRFLGSNQVVIYPVSSVINPDAKPITFDEALGMEELSMVERVHIALGGPATAARGWAKLDTSISGTVAPTIKELAQKEDKKKERESDWILAQGEPFTRNDVDYESRVCVIGHTVAEQLFPDEDPVGQTIRIKGIPFLVIGVFEGKLQEKGQFSDPNNFIKIPISTAAAEFYGRDVSVSVTADIVSEKSVSDAMSEIVAYLRQCHEIVPAAGGEDDFTIHSFETEAKAAMESAKTFSSLLSGLAAIALVVGGIGIMNIMLVSVSERTREIGILKTIGARHVDIIRQFLLEATVLGLAGGLLGVAAGIGAIPVINHYSTNLFAAFAWYSLPLAFTFSFLVGIIFGFYPALRASRLDPIEALRHE